MEANSGSKIALKLASSSILSLVSLGVKIRPEEEITKAPSATNLLAASRTGIVETLNFFASDLRVRTCPGFNRPPRISDLSPLYINSCVGKGLSFIEFSLFIKICDHKIYSLSTNI